MVHNQKIGCGFLIKTSSGQKGHQKWLTLTAIFPKQFFDHDQLPKLEEYLCRKIHAACLDFARNNKS